MDSFKAQALFQRLLQIPSVTASAFEQTACALLEEALDAYGISHERIFEAPERPNLLAWLKAAEPDKAPLVFISHIDVVDGSAQQWDFPVFDGTVHEGRIRGRGALDTKQLTVMELNAFLSLKGKPLRRDVYFLATVDEEAGSQLGMAAVKRLRPDLFENALVVNEGGGFPVWVDEQPYMTVTIGEKAVFQVAVFADGTAGHASAPGEDQAMVKMAAALQKLFEGPCAFQSGSRLTAQAIKAATQGKPLCGAALNLYEYACGTSLSMRNWQIGQRVNVLPQRAQCIVEVKTLPGTNPKDVLAFFESRLHGTGAQYTLISFEEGFENPLDARFLSLIKAGCKKAGHAMPLFPMLALGRTDGRFFGQSRSQVFGCSPCLETDSFDRVLQMVHGPNESIAQASFHFGCEVLTYAAMADCIKEVEPK